MEMVAEERTTQRQMAIVERFEGFMNYMYPIALNIPRAHYVARDRLVSLMFEQVSLFYQAAKSNQVSKLYLADAGLADLRFLLRFLVDEKRRFISRRRRCETQDRPLSAPRR